MPSLWGVFNRSLAVLISAIGASLPGATGKRNIYGPGHAGAMLPDGFPRRDAMLVLAAMNRITSISTAEGASGRVGTREVLDALRRMERPEDFWDLLYAYWNDKILDMHKDPRGDLRFSVAEVQAHDVEVFLHQNRVELESFASMDTDEGELTSVYLDGLEEARARAVFY